MPRPVRGASSEGSTRGPSGTVARAASGMESLGAFALLLAGLSGLQHERTGLAGRFDALDKAGERLERLLDGRLQDLRGDAAASAKDLREEVRTHLTSVADSLERRQD